MIDIQLDKDEFEELRTALQREKLISRAAEIALNHAASLSATSIRRTVSKVMQVPVRKLGRNTGSKSGRGMIRPLYATEDRLNARVRLLNFNLPMIESRRKPERGEVWPLEKLSNGVALDNSPFKQTMHSGHLGWYVRYGPPRKMESGDYTGRVRQPIRQIFTHSPRWWFENQCDAGNESDAAQTHLEDEIHRQIARYLTRKG